MFKFDMMTASAFGGISPRGGKTAGYHSDLLESVSGNCSPMCPPLLPMEYFKKGIVEVVPGP